MLWRNQEISLIVNGQERKTILVKKIKSYKNDKGWNELNPHPSQQEM